MAITRKVDTDVYCDICGKLVQSGTHTINMILRAMGQPQINEEWANKHFITKNYSTVQDLLNSLEGGGENGGNGKNTE